jgi:hypothetical protein
MTAKRPILERHSLPNLKTMHLRYYGIAVDFGEPKNAPAPGIRRTRIIYLLVRFRNSTRTSRSYGATEPSVFLRSYPPRQKASAIRFNDQGVLGQSGRSKLCIMGYFVRHACSPQDCRSSGNLFRRATELPRLRALKSVRRRSWLYPSSTLGYRWIIHRSRQRSAQSSRKG